MSRTPEEQKTLEAIAAATAAGEDVFGDDEDLVRDLPTDGPTDEADEDDSSATDAQAAATTEQQDEGQKTASKADDLDPLELQEIANPRSEQPARYDANVPADYKEQRTRLLSEKAAAMKQLMDGEIEADTYAETEGRIADQLDTLMAQRIRAETLQEANSQNEQQYAKRELNKLATRVKEEIDYKTDPTAPKEFDRALGLLMADPENADRDYAEVLGDAHRMVMAMRGLKAPPKAASADAAKAAADAARRPGGTVPQTLRNLPSASLPNTGGGVIEQMAHLKGPEYEAAFSKLTPQQRANLLDEEA